MVQTADITPGEMPGDAVGPLHASAEMIRSHAAQFRRDSEPEHIHKIRVTTRRTRATLAAFPQNKETIRLQTELRDFARSLGSLRDADVSNEVIASALSRYPKKTQAALRPLVNSMNFAASDLRVDVANRFRAVEFFDMLARLNRYHPDDSGDSVPADADFSGEKYVRRLTKTHKRWTKKQTRENLHDLRVAAKKLRYALSVRDGERRDDRVGKARIRLAKLQDLLGDINDLHFARRKVQDVLESADWPETTVRLTAKLETRLARRATKLTGKVDRAYRRATSKKNLQAIGRTLSASN